MPHGSCGCAMARPSRRSTAAAANGAAGSRSKARAPGPCRKTSIRSNGESPLQLALVQAWVASDKLEWMVEKAVELGVTEVVLVPAARSVIQLDEPRRQRRLTRLHEIVTAACCQSGRNRVPDITSTTSLERGLSAALAAGSRGLLLDPHATETLPDDLLRSSAVAVAIGPEGGFDEAEHALAVRLGYRPTRLGPRILRTETAGIAALAALQMLGGGLR